MQSKRWLAGSMAGMVLLTAALGWGCKSSSTTKATPTNTKAAVTATRTHTPAAAITQTPYPLTPAATITYQTPANTATP